ncbi:MAG TPA: hypothetical protein GXX51_00215 [Firmicutes bacterium]|nr:hypothetical protein [Bacillota bacterium]
MSIRPLDVQNVISKAQEVERIQRVQDEGAKLQQQAFASELQRKADERSQQVTSTPESRGSKIENQRQRDGKNSGKSGKHSGKGRGQEAGAYESLVDIQGGAPGGATGRGSKLDVEV